MENKKMFETTNQHASHSKNVSIETTMVTTGDPPVTFAKPRHGNDWNDRPLKSGLQDGAPKIAKLPYKWFNYGLWKI